jgi:hypothetical protein
MNPVQTVAPYVFKNHLNINLSTTPRPSKHFSSSFLTKILHAFHKLPRCAIRATHVLLHDLIILIIFHEQYKLWSSSLCKFLQPLVKFKYSPQHPVLKHNLYVSLDIKNQVSHPCKTTSKIIILNILILSF